MSHNLKCELLIWKTKTKHSKGQLGNIQLFFCLLSFMNVKCFTPWIANHSHPPLLLPTQTATCGCVFVFFSSRKQFVEVLLRGCKKRNTTLLSILACLIGCVCVAGGFVFSWFRASLKWRSSPRCLPWVPPAAESRVTALGNVPPPHPQTQLTSLCGAQGQLVMFIASASDQSPQRPKERGSEWEEGRKRKRDRQMGEGK